MRSMFGKISFSALVLAIGVILPSSQSFASENYGVAKMTEPFADPGEQTARAYAMTEELTISEATRRLRLMSEAARLAYQLQVRYPDTVSGVEVVGGRGFRVAVYGVRDAIGAIEKTSRQISSSSELGQILDFRSAPTSAAAISASAKLQLAGLRASGIEAVIASNARTGQTKLLVKDSTATLMGLVDGALRATVGTRIEHFDGIFTTATEVPGGQLYDGPTYKCTRGFNVKQINGSLYGISTAGHCDNSGTDGPTGKTLAFKQEWTTNGLDSQWSTFSGSQAYLLVPKFYNGTSMITVTGGSYETPGMYACKFGLTTLQTCGTIDPYMYTDLPYGDFPRMNWNENFPKQSIEGDSGGPVYFGSLAIGQVHGRDGGYIPGPHTNMYFTPIRAWGSNNLPIGVTCYC